MERKVTYNFTDLNPYSRDVNLTEEERQFYEKLAIQIKEIPLGSVPDNVHELGGVYLDDYVRVVRRSELMKGILEISERYDNFKSKNILPWTINERRFTFDEKGLGREIESEFTSHYLLNNLEKLSA